MLFIRRVGIGKFTYGPGISEVRGLDTLVLKKEKLGITIWPKLMIPRRGTQITLFWSGFVPHGVTVLTSKQGECTILGSGEVSHPDSP